MWHPERTLMILAIFLLSSLKKSDSIGRLTFIIFALLIGILYSLNFIIKDFTIRIRVVSFGLAFIDYILLIMFVWFGSDKKL